MKFGTLAKAADSSRRILNQYDAYMTGRRNVHREAEAIAYILTRNAPVDGNPERDRTGSWSASAAGRCSRAQQFVALGYPGAVSTDADSENIFVNGDFLHLRYQMVGLIQGWLTDVEVPLTYRGGSVRGTTDGLLVWDEILELKSINTRGYDQVAEFGPKEDHKCQATSYMLCTGYQGTRFLYEDKNTNRNIEIPFALEQEYVEKVIAQWEALDAAKEQRELLPMLHECVNERGAFRWCPWKKVCENATYPSLKLRLV